MLFAAVYDFFSGAINALIISCVAQISELREIGTRVGVLYSMISLLALCGGGDPQAERGASALAAERAQPQGEGTQAAPLAAAQRRRNTRPTLK
ncbi:hypothetical protein LXA43DRAFT_1018579 [Ganoderma leucocontextum]|nr:hypothetical protein LXA43DRAFT_1018579 [Ganoderma leucocontextum]